ncbi:transposase (resolvase, DNA invertase) (plasmid) [Legionella adelaidensis]|uniref:Transposase (Resolvase, DNA invertase) n=1 Tax=Legionella adelaidensis TaxID=45056 RepID=A0A3S4UBU3_9GAMM|nr:transposase (resolvase, DNA invertase) [Legionella adelaidensis]
MRVGYARVFTHEQNLDLQLDDKLKLVSKYLAIEIFFPKSLLH